MDVFFSSLPAIFRGWGLNGLTGYESRGCLLECMVMRTTIDGQADTRFAVNRPPATNLAGGANCARTMRFVLQELLDPRG